MGEFLQDKKTGKMLGAKPGPGKANAPTPLPAVPASSTAAVEGSPVDYVAQHRVLQDREAAAARQVSQAGTVIPNPGMLRPKPKPVAPREQTTPGGYTLSAHLVKQAKQKGVAYQDLVDCVDFPSTTYESHRYPGQVKHIRGDICVAVDPADRRAITVFLDRVETDLRRDQRSDVDAQEWDRRRKQRR